MSSWATGVTDIADGEILVRGYPLQDLIGSLSFGEVLFLLLGGELPTPAAAKVMNAVLVASLDHGTTSPSAITARTVVSGGAAPQVGAAAGLLALSKYHGAAVEGAAHTLVAVMGRHAQGLPLQEAARAVVGEQLAVGERVPGYGHRVHDSDPRVERLFAIARAEGVDQRYVAAAQEVAAALEAAKGRRFPMNLDTAIAAVLLPYLNPGQILGVFMASRFCGIYTQALEEHTRMKPMRRIEPSQWVYDGPARRPVSR